MNIDEANIILENKIKVLKGYEEEGMLNDSMLKYVEALETVVKKLKLTSVGSNEVAVWDKYTPKFKDWVKNRCIEKEIDQTYIHNGITMELDSLFFKYNRMFSLDKN